MWQELLVPTAHLAFLVFFQHFLIKNNPNSFSKNDHLQLAETKNILKIQNSIKHK
jgi:hypothetical protein